jgi:hypothetical protein
MSNQIQSDFKPRKEAEYRAYLIWKNMPMKWLGMGRDYLENMGIRDEAILQLSGIQTQKDFAEQYDLNEDTLVKWNKAKPPVEFQDIDWRKWAMPLTKNVVATLYDRITGSEKGDGDAARIKLWLQAVDGYVEEQNVNHDVSHATLLGVRELIVGINKKAEAKNE